MVGSIFPWEGSTGGLAAILLWPGWEVFSLQFLVASMVKKKISLARVGPAPHPPPMAAYATQKVIFKHFCGVLSL